MLAGPILAHLDYHWLFWIPFAAIVVATIATVIIVPESPVRARGGVDVVGAILLSLWLVLLLVAMSEAPSRGWLSPVTIGLLVMAVVAAVAWIKVELGSREPLVDMGMMRLRGVWTTNLAGFLLGMGMFGAFILIPQFVQMPRSSGYGFGSSVTQAGLFLVPSSLMMLVAAPVAGRLAGRFGSKPLLVLGTSLSLAAAVLLTVAHGSHAQIYVASFVLGTGFGFAFASMINLIVEAVPPEQTGIATGMNAVMRTIGGAIGGQIAATVLAANLAAGGLPAEKGYTISFAVTSPGSRRCDRRRARRSRSTSPAGTFRLDRRAAGIHGMRLRAAHSRPDS